MRDPPWPPLTKGGNHLGRPQANCESGEVVRSLQFRRTGVMRRYQREISVAAAWLVVLAVLAAAAPAFYRLDQLRVLLVNAAPLLVAALGTTLVIIAGQID